MKDRILQQPLWHLERTSILRHYLESLSKKEPGGQYRKSSEEEIAAVPARPSAISCTTITVSVAGNHRLFLPVGPEKTYTRTKPYTANLKVDLNDKEVLHAAVDRIMERLHLTPHRPELDFGICERPYLEQRAVGHRPRGEKASPHGFLSKKLIWPGTRKCAKCCARQTHRRTPHRAQLRAARLFGHRAERGGNFRAEMEAWGLGFDHSARGQQMGHLSPAHRRRQHEGGSSAARPRLH